MEKVFIWNQNSEIVETDKGKIRGYAYDGIHMFKGVPYAKARRFHRPEPVEPWEGIFDATNYGYVCPLLDSKSRPGGELMVPHRFWVMNEDCQNLNIWTRGCDDQKRPVMVWLHGGGFEAGSSIEQIAYEGENMAKSGDVVVVSINHRLNVLGYMDFSAFGPEYENSGNCGGDDIIAALKWINRNISAFGGDPENVTVFGQSGGGAKVTTLLQSPEADGLYARGIVMSGVIGGGLISDCTSSGEDMVRALMQECKVDSVQELETVPYETLAEAYLKLRPILGAQGKNVGGAPFVNRFYKGNPLYYGFREETKDIPLMVGSVFGEFASFAPCPYPRNTMSNEEGWQVCEQLLGSEAIRELRPLFEKAYPNRKPVDMLNLDFIFRSSELEYVRKRGAINSSCYSYLFDVDMPVDGGRTPWHCCDIPYFFKNSELVPIAQIPGVSDRVEYEIFTRVMAFAHSGDPNSERLVRWPSCTETEEPVLVINAESEIKTNFDEKLVPLFAKYIQPVFERQMKSADIQH